MTTDRALDVTGRGIVSALGQTVDAFTQAIFAGHSAIGPIADLGFGVRFPNGAPIRDFVPGDHFDDRSLSTLDRFAQFATVAARAAWAEAGGYDDVQYGWEDYDLWCRFAERGLAGLHLADILADYRTHPNSMIHADTEQPDQRRALIADMESRHPWLRLTGRR